MAERVAGALTVDAGEGTGCAPPILGLDPFSATDVCPAGQDRCTTRPTKRTVPAGVDAARRTVTLSVGRVTKATTVVAELFTLGTRRPVTRAVPVRVRPGPLRLRLPVLPARRGSFKAGTTRFVLGLRSQSGPQRAITRPLGDLTVAVRRAPR